MRKVFQENGCTDSRCDSGSIKKGASSILRAASKGEKACFSELRHMPGKEKNLGSMMSNRHPCLEWDFLERDRLTTRSLSRANLSLSFDLRILPCE
ncbi:unnamed protein product [Sphenostylis stenocarpa]|uniref:Uncharacterized protein n=1 Tax=Sphenostylis stenocarpa TaxID=92480 RepID=A0AA86VAQ5_9FABA|nr:unnamed protein product [Sphenostylis stenocarpa]